MSRVSISECALSTCAESRKIRQARHRAHSSKKCKNEDESEQARRGTALGKGNEKSVKEKGGSVRRYRRACEGDDARAGGL